MGKGGVHHVHTLNPKRAKYEGHVTGYVLLTYIVGAFGGLIFGYDIGSSGNAKVCVYALEYVAMSKMHLKRKRKNKNLYHFD